MAKKSEVLTEPAHTPFSHRISTKEAARRLGFSESRLRLYALDGLIPGARQVAKGKRWTFDPELLERWWQRFNAPRMGEF